MESQKEKPQPAIARKPATPHQSLADQLPKLDGQIPDNQQIPVEKFAFVLPEKVRKNNSYFKDPKRVVIRELTEAELDSADRVGRKKAEGKSDADKRREITFECVRKSLVEVGFEWNEEKGFCPDMRPVNRMENEDEILWSKFSLKCRYLLVEAWREVNQTSKELDDAFLATMTPA